MTRPCPTPRETADALYEANVIVEILNRLGDAAKDEATIGVAFTWVHFLTGLLDIRLDLIEEAARAKGAAA